MNPLNENKKTLHTHRITIIRPSEILSWSALRRWPSPTRPALSSCDALPPPFSMAFVAPLPPARCTTTPFINAGSFAASTLTALPVSAQRRATYRRPRRVLCSAQGEPIRESAGEGGENDDGGEGGEDSETNAPSDDTSVSDLSIPDLRELLSSGGKPDCVQCHGKGEIECMVCDGKGFFSLTMMEKTSAGQCRMCRGNRVIPCPSCKEFVYKSVLWWDQVPSQEEDPNEEWRDGPDGPRIDWTGPPTSNL